MCTHTHTFTYIYRYDQKVDSTLEKYSNGLITDCIIKFFREYFARIM